MPFDLVCLSGTLPRVTFWHPLCLPGEYCDLSKFKRIYVVDLCKSLCEQVQPYF